MNLKIFLQNIYFDKNIFGGECMQELNLLFKYFTRDEYTNSPIDMSNIISKLYA